MEKEKEESVTKKTQEDVSALTHPLSYLGFLLL